MASRVPEPSGWVCVEPPARLPTDELRSCSLRRSRKGRTFFGCSAYPACSFVVWQRPVAEPCPKCGATFVTERVARGRQTRTCVREGCDYKREEEIPVA